MLTKDAPKGTKDYWDTDLSDVMTEAEIEEYLAQQKKYTGQPARAPIIDPNNPAALAPVSAPPKSVLGPSGGPTGGVPSPLAPKAIKGGGVSGGNRLPPSDPFADFYADQQNRIPRGGELEGYSSDTIADLLNPPDFFPEVDRRSAESAAGRGISGSPAGFGAGLRMTDEERLKRIALGQGFLTGAFGRNPAIDPAYMFLTEQQKAQLALDKQKLELQKKAIELDNELKRLQIRNLSAPSVVFPGSGGGGRGGMLSPGTPLNRGWGSDGNAIPDYSGTAPIGGGLQNIGNTLGNDLPDSWDPNWDWTG